MRVLVLDAALAGCLAALVTDGTVDAERRLPGPRQTASLPVLVRDVLGARAPDLVAVTVGPGSFTGLRAALALAHGLALGHGVRVVGVTVAEALGAEALAADDPDDRRAFWVALASGRGRLFLDRGEGMMAIDPADLPMPSGPVTIAGDAAIEVAATLAARGFAVRLSDARAPRPRAIAAVAQRRAEGRLPPVPAQPLYVDPPEARPGPLRPPPLAPDVPR